jgi:hypothetical protein
MKSVNRGICRKIWRKSGEMKGTFAHFAEKGGCGEEAVYNALRNVIT